MKKPVKLEDYVVLAKIEEPTSFSEAMTSPQLEKWIKAMEEELLSICDNNTWDLVDLPKDKKAIGSKWVFKVKYDQDGTVQRYKACLVAQGFDQRYESDYDEVFAPVARARTIRILLSVAAEKQFKVKHFDIKTAFLNGKLKEEIFMKQPPGYSIGN